MTYHFELGHHPTKTGDYTIFLLVYQKGERKRIKTTITVPIKYWDTDKERVKKSCPTSKEDNKELQDLLVKAKAVERELNSQGKLTMMRFLDGFQGKEQSYMLITYAKHIRETMVLGKQWGTYKKYGDTINKLTNYILWISETSLLPSYLVSHLTFNLSPVRETQKPPFHQTLLPSI